MKTHCDCGRKLKHEDSIKEGICGVCKNSNLSRASFARGAMAMNRTAEKGKEAGR